MNDESRPDNSDLLLLSMDSSEAHRDHSNGINYEINDSEMVLSTSHLVNSHTYTLPPMKPHCEMLRCSNSSEEYLSKNGFINDITDTVPLNLQDMNSRYRLNKQPSINFQKEPLTDDSGSAYTLKSLTNDIQDLSFSVDLRTLNRDVQESSNYNYYNRNVTSSADMYASEFSHEFSNNSFTASLPSTSGMFSNDDTSTNYVLSEAQSDELLLNGIELNENEKLILSNEEIAMLTQSKPGSCLELILNNGEVLYAVIDSENDYTPASPRMMQVSKEIIPPRQVELDNNLVPVNELQTEQYSSNFSKTPPITEFTTSNSTNYHSVISTTLSKSINTSPITTENFNLCCNFSTVDSATQFTSVMDTYPSIVSEKHYDQSLPSYCPSTSAQKEIPTQADSKIVSNPQVQSIPSKLDYFPNAVNSIVVSETGKKYPKKYSFYSNNFSSFLNQQQTSKSSPPKGDHTSNNPDDSNEKTNTDKSIRKPNETEQELLKRGFQPVASCDLQKIEISPPTESVSVLKRIISSVPPADNNRTSVINVNTKKQLTNEEKSINSKCLNSRAQSAVNTICDRAVQSRARATLPSAYLSINRIKSEPGSKKSVYGVFARKTIPSRTQFGPVEGILIKQEQDDTIEDNPDLILKLTVESEKGKFSRLDVSNEELSNWMRFVRPAKTFHEQNLILSQQGSSLYFTTIEVIHPKQELLVWYGAYYSQTRNYSLLEGDPCANGSQCNDFDQIDTVKVDKSPLSSPNTEQTTQNADGNEMAVCMDVDKYVDGDDDDVVIETDFSLNSVAESGTKNIKAKSAISVRKQDKLNKSLWLCTYCDLTFSNASVMNLHILIHAADNVEEINLKKPKQLEEQSENTCPQCNQAFPRKQQLIVHVSKHGLKVQRWSDKNVDRNDMQESNKTVDKPEDEIFECSPCKKKFKNPAALSVHKRFHSDDSVLECPICETTFQKLTAMREHVHNHAINGVYTCPHCPKKYDRYKHIRKHIRACHCKVTFSCKLCKMNFKSQYKLKSHMLRHSDEREFLCANCGKQFKRKDKLTEHMKNMHSEERERKSLEIMNNATKKDKSMSKKTLKKRLPTKVLRLITENVNDYFYKCYICNIGFKRRGMLVNHLNSFHPGVGLDTVPELNVPILKAYCNFYCLYCDKVYKSNSKRKAHIIKTHPGAKIPGNLERGTVLNDPYAKHVGSVISNPFNCEFCPRQYASRAKLLNHHRKNHADLLPADMKAPRSWNSQRKKRKTEIKLENVPNNTNGSGTAATLNNVQIQSVEFEIENNSAVGVNVSTQEDNDLQQTTKENSGDVNQQIMSLTHLLNEELRNSTTQEQYLKILSSSNGITIAQTDENGEHPVSLENSSALLQQILASYSFTSS